MTGQLAETEFKFMIFYSASASKSFLIRTFFVAASISPGTASGFDSEVATLALWGLALGYDLFKEKACDTDEATDT